MRSPTIKGRRQSAELAQLSERAAVPSGSDVEVGRAADSIEPIRWFAGPDGSTEYFGRQSDGKPQVHPDDVERVASGWAHAIRTQTPFHLDYRIRQGAGEYRWHSFRATPVRDERNVVFRWVGTATDIEDAEWSKPIRLAYQKSAETSTLLEMLMSKAPIGFGFVDRDFRMVILNETLADITGVPVAEQVGRPVAEIIPLLWPQLEVLYRHVLDTREAILDTEVSGSWPGNPLETRHVLTSYYPVIQGNDVLGIGIIVVDITARKRAEAATRFQAELLAAAGQAMVAVDLDGVITYWNSDAEEMYGWSRDEVIGRNGVDLVAGQGPTDQAKVMEDAMVQGQRSTGDCIVTRRDGGTISVLVTATPVFDQDRHLTGVIACAVDVTALKAGDEARRQLVRRAAETRFEIGVEQSAVGALIANLDGTPTRVNAAMCAILGRPAEALIDRAWTDYEHPGEVPLWDAVASGVAGGQDTYSDERRFVRPDGTVVWALSNVTLARDDARQAQYYFVQLQDITERKRAG